MRLSVSRSTLAVASSRTRILESRRMARARQMSYFWPTENRLLDSETMVIRPSCILLIWSKRFTSFRMFNISSSVLSEKGSRFSRIEPWSKNGVYGIKAILFRRRCKPTSRIFTPSISIFPFSSSTRRNKVYKMDDLPAPVLPTMPTFIRGCILRLNSFTLGSRKSL